MNKFIMIAILPFILINVLYAEQITIRIQKPYLENNNFMRSDHILKQPGNPKMAFIPVKILIPMKKEISDISIVPTEKFYIPDVSIEHAKTQLPISSNSFNDTSQNEKVYGIDAYFPANTWELISTQSYRGYKIALIHLYPYQYNPIQSILQYYKDVTLEISYQEDDNWKESNRKLRLDDSTISNVQKMVVNPDNISTYSRSFYRFDRNLPSPDDPYSMIIVTDETRLPFFNDFIEWKETHGIHTGTFLTSDIYNSYPGEDNPAKIRNFIIDAYEIYAGTEYPLEYVILGGDDEIVPIRGAYGRVGYTEDLHIPCDLYYSCLDGNWDQNGNGIYGESEDGINELDLMPEIALGRIPAETESEFMNFFDKTYHYVENSVVSNDIAYMFGENLNWDPLTWGAWYKDEVRPLIENNSDFNIFTLYDMDGTYSNHNVKDAINNGLAIINHMGHSNETMVFGQTLGMVNNYFNEDYGFAYSQGCYPAAFDQGTSGNSESIAENLVKSEHGLFAFVGNTRYGWYSPGDTNGASQFFDIAFFEALFEQNLRDLGSALQYSRNELVSEALSNDVMRWVYYELVLFGDPSIEVKDASNSFPFLEPVSLAFNDVNGDGDQMVNPNEQIQITPTIENLPNWSDAESVSCIAIFPEEFTVYNDSIFIGDIGSGTSVTSSENFEVLIPASCNYADFEFELTILAPIDETTSFEKTFTLTIPVTLFQTNWPIYSNQSVKANPVVIGENQKQILLTDTHANHHQYSIDGNLVQEIDSYEETIKKSAAIADINLDSEVDIVYCSRNGNIFATTLDGEEIFRYETDEDFLLTPVVADLNADGQWETICVSLSGNIYALNSDGNLLPNFPFELDQISLGELAAADLDNDGSAEIVAGTLSGNLYAITNSGDLLNGFPVTLGESIKTAPSIMEDGTIIVQTLQNNLFFISSDGIVLNSIDVGNPIANSVIIANFDEDNDNEIAFATLFGEIFIVKKNGDILPGWPVQIDDQFSNPPVVADLDNDDSADLIIATNLNEIYALHANGTISDETPVPLHLGNDTPTTIDDIDHDGDYDLVGSTENNIYIIDFKTPKGDQIPWRTYRGNYRRTGYCNDNELTDYDESNVPTAGLTLNQNYPNPFNPSTTIDFYIPETSNTTLTIYNLKGQKVRTLIDNEKLQGVFTYRWNGKNEEGSSVSSGIYLYKLQTKEHQITKKCILLK